MSPLEPDEPGLFDLPLEAPPPPPPLPERATRAGRKGRRAAAAEEALLFEAPAEELPDLPPVARHSGKELMHPQALTPLPPRDLPRAPTAPVGQLPAPMVARFRAAAGDLLVFLAVAVVQITGLALLGVRPRLAHWPGLLAFQLAFSFLYMTISLAFWGQTPGMAWAGIVARSGESEALAFGQTARRWLGALATFVAAGLPGLLALGGRSLADLVSGSRTYLVVDRELA